MLIADKFGHTVDFECYPDWEDEVTPAAGVIGTGNRFTVNPSRNRVIDPALDRGLRLRSLLAEHRDEISAEMLMELLKDHEGYPDSICRHLDETGHSTVYSIIIDMAADKVYICPGNPCKNEYKEYSL